MSDLWLHTDEKPFNWPKNKPFWRHEVIGKLEFNLPSEFKGIKKEYRDPNTDQLYFRIEDRVLHIYPGYRFDGVTAFPDLDYLMLSAVAHDALLQGEYQYGLWKGLIKPSHKVFRTIGLEEANKQDNRLTRRKQRIIVKSAYGGLKLLHGPYHKHFG